ncbi:MAG TPA: gephyrin-like molybdotransferase Glp [Candidatus Dormibacteraeota bacterium]|nr:gephyrin-like molybdotransferase Glp [Candidatus Dormibacteraeota bacterium]
MSPRAEAAPTLRQEKPLSVAAARREMLKHLPQLATEEVRVDGGAAWRVLAADVVAEVLLPPWDNSAMDGYAVRAADVRKVPLRLPVVWEIAAGMAPGTVKIEAGTCAKVMTGAPLPQAADAVVPYEWTDRGETEVLILERPRPGNAIRRAGEDLSPGDRIFPAGHRLRPTDLAPLAASGLATAKVSQRPRVAVITTGDEIQPAGTKLGPGEIYDTAGPALEALIAAAGGDVVLRLRVGDDPQLVERELMNAAALAEVVVTVGGVSVGDHDHVRATVERLGRLRLWRVAMRPGRPIAFGELGNSTFIGLPGNPVSATVTFILFGAPCLLAMQGASDLGPVTQFAELLEAVDKPEGLETFHRAVVRPRPGQLPGVRVAGTQSSGATLSLARADALLVLPATGARLEQGAVVEIIPL